MLRKRLSGLVLILPLLLGLGGAAYKFGPNPTKSAEQPATNSAPTVKAQTSTPQTQNAQLLELFGMYQQAVAKGRVTVAPTEYLNSIEALYKLRGYQKAEIFDPDKVAKKSRGKVRKRETRPVKFFQRDESSGIANISATGTDADYSSNETAAEPYTFSTVVVPAENGGSDWATYKIGLDRNKLGVLGELDSRDFPGTDPKDIPRLPGLQRIYALSSASGSLAIYKTTEATDTALMLRFLEEMPRHGWTLDSNATSGANKVASGVMCFRQGTRSCLIWVTQGKPKGTTNVTISSY